MGCPLGRCGPFTDDATQPSNSVYCRCGLHSVATTVTHSFVAAPHRARPALFASIALPVMRDVNELPPLRRANSLAPPAVVGNSEARGHPAPHDTRSPVRCSFATPRPHSPTSPPPPSSCPSYPRRMHMLRPRSCGLAISRKPRLSSWEHSTGGLTRLSPEPTTSSSSCRK